MQAFRYLIIVGLLVLSLGLHATPKIQLEDDIATYTLPLVRIGVLAYRPKPQTLEQWRPLGVLLNHALPQYDFVIEALTYPELTDAIAKRQLDFVLTNSSNYIFHKHQFGLSSPIATLAVDEHGIKTTHFGGVIFTLTKEKINTLSDIKGKIIAASNQESFGGYQMQAYELFKAGISVVGDNTLEVTGLPHDNVVKAILSGHAHVGFVRSGILENMAEEGLLDMSSIKILNLQNEVAFPVKISTRLYPEWPLSTLPHVNEKLSKSVLSILFRLDENDKALKAMHIYGFNIPANYNVVEELLKALRLPPFDAKKIFNFNDIWEQYHEQIIALMILLGCALSIGIIHLRNSNRLLHKSLQQQKDQADTLAQFLQVIEQSPISIIITELDGTISYANPKFIDITGYSKTEIIGHNPRFLKSGKVPEQTYALLWKQLKKGKIWEGELINRRKDGSDYIEWGTIAPLHKNDGSITQYVAIKEDITQRKIAEEKIYHLAFYDQLTSLPNRQKIIYDMRVKEAKACAIFNIDSFKEINDLFGINAGDNILIQVGKWFKEIGIFAYRTGGDEFTTLFYDSDVESLTLSRRILNIMALLEEKTFHVEDEIISLRMSVGVAIGGSKLLTHADIALHVAKIKKIPLSLYEEKENIEEKYRHNIVMASMIRKALISGRIICHYQPIVDFKTNATTKYETLVRMVDEEGNLILPLEFLPIAKKMKIYPRITQEVVTQACELFQHRTEEFSINLSTADMEDARSMQKIIEVIKQTNTASRIVFEILESEGIENYDTIKQFIAQVKVLGAKIAIDDFGTGYSNFEHILKLNVDYIKIDGSLIRNIANNSRNHIVIETIVTFAKKIGALTIAEFVSDETIFNTVKKLNVTYSQGYFTGIPAPLLKGDTNAL
ncbi:MAG: EAL domain-containing protein [Sulfurospirillaceae bacterium]|nr:EAL domain-containing protein [Sulfurospirillaceae bacterium]MDD2827511.1 EAL domain-containing protein [Sulfurospirillaceae bacterium]